MSSQTQQIVNHAWNFAHALRDDGLSYMGYTEQITFLLFLKMADELASPIYNREPMVPRHLDWQSLLRLPTGIFYAQGVKANVVFFDNRPAREQPWTERLWVYDLRTNGHFTLKQNPLRREHLDELVTCYRPQNRHEREQTWSEDNPDGRWRCFDYEELKKRDKLNLDIFWIRDESLEESDNLPDPDVIALEIADDLEAALEQFREIVNGLEE